MAKKANQQTTEIAVVENQKLTELAQKSGIELTKAEAHVSAFHPALVELSELSRPLATLDKENPTIEHAKTARENRLKIVKVRTGSEGIKDDRKKILLIESNLIQDAFNLVKSACILTESEYEEIEKHQERVEVKRRDELKETRIALLAPFETDTEFLPLEIMDEERFQLLLAKEKEAFEAVKKAREQSELDRVKAEHETELARLAEIEAEKQGQIERDTENERLQIELAEKQKESDRLAVIVEAEKVEAQKLADEKQKEVDELRKKNEAIELVAENERLAKVAEQESKDAKAKALLLGPDKDKVKAFFETFKALQFPDLQSESGKAMTVRVNQALAIVKQVIIQDSKKLV